MPALPVLRDVIILDARNDEVAGFVQRGHTTFHDVYTDYFPIVFPRHGPGKLLLRTRSAYRSDDPGKLQLGSSRVVPPGHYDLITYPDKRRASPQLSAVPVRYRPLGAAKSKSLPTKAQAGFRDRLRARDGGCVVSGSSGRFGRAPSETLEGAHLVPKAHIDHWLSKSFEDCITVEDANEGPAKIDSVQNGILLDAALYKLFKSHGFGINTRTNRIVFFRRAFEANLYDNKTPKIDWSETHAPLRKLVDDHFHQCVLANVRGTGDVKLLEYGDAADAFHEMEKYETGEGKLWFETYLQEALLERQYGRVGDIEYSPGPASFVVSSNPTPVIYTPE